jgi:hypothetical protein
VYVRRRVVLAFGFLAVDLRTIVFAFVFLEFPLVDFFTCIIYFLLRGLRGVREGRVFGFGPVFDFVGLRGFWP